MRQVACQKVGWIRATRDSYDTVLVLGELVESASLMVTNVALLLQPQEAGIISLSVQLGGLVEEVLATTGAAS